MRFFYFGKRVLAFGLTFGISIFILGLVSIEPPSQNKVAKVNFDSEKKQCLPVDENLKYEKLPTREKSLFIPAEKEMKIQIEKKDNIVEPKQKSLSSEKSIAEYQILLHKEKCNEFNGRK